MYAGEAQHPVFVALQGTVRKHDLPKQPFADLIHAFVHDQTVTRYRELGRACSITASIRRIRSAGCCCICAGTRDAERQRLSDATCTALQLANFWQDVSVDLKKDRVYIPLEVCEAARVLRCESCSRGVEDARFRAVMKEMRGSRARACSSKGCRWRARWTGGWLSISNCSAAADCWFSKRSSGRITTCCDNRPAIGKLERVRLLLGDARARSVLQGCMTPVERSYAYCRSVARTQARNFYYSFLSAVEAAARRHVRHLRVHALLRRSERRTRYSDAWQRCRSGERNWMQRFRAAMAPNECWPAFHYAV